MNGGFLPNNVLKKSTAEWNGTLHDINHQGIGAWEMDIRYFIGYHSNAKYDSAKKELSMDLNLDMNTKFADDWKAFINLCKNAGQIPNVSCTYMASIIYKKANELPVNYKDYGLHSDDLVPYVEKIFPAAVATVVIGRCSDKDGCGLKNEACPDGKCKIITKTDTKLEEKRQELIGKIKIMENKNNEQK